MRVLGINGSPHENGNTAYALRYGLSLLNEAGAETEYVTLGTRRIEGCRGCLSCTGGKCVHDDDMQLILDGMCQCDCLLLASPVYMGMVSGQMKTMMDRTVILRVRDGFELSGKIGAGIACGGFRNGGQELTLQCMHTFFLQQDMLAIADGPPFSHSGAAIVGKAEDDELGLETVRNIVNKILRTLRA